MKMENYHIILPCKRSFDADPSQTLEYFSVDLPEEIDVNQDWELALTEMTYPKVWVNIPDDQKIEVLMYDPEKSCSYKAFHSNEWVVKKGQYTLDTLMVACNNIIETKITSEVLGREITSVPVLTLRETERPLQQRYGIFEEKERFFIRYDEILGNVLGFGYNEVTHRAQSVFKDYLEANNLLKFPSWHLHEGSFKDFNLDRNLQNIYVSCNAIKNSFYGANNTDIIRIVDVPENTVYGETIHQIFKHLYYYPMNKEKLNHIKIKLYQGVPGESALVPFTCGTVLLHLHLKRSFKLIEILRELEPASAMPQESFVPEEFLKTGEPIKPGKTVEPDEPLIQNPHRSRIV